MLLGLSMPLSSIAHVFYVSNHTIFVLYIIIHTFSREILYVLYLGVRGSPVLIPSCQHDRGTVLDKVCPSVTGLWNKGTYHLVYWNKFGNQPYGLLTCLMLTIAGSLIDRAL